MPRDIIVNSRCTLISNSENETLFRILGPNCHTLSSAVVQLFLADTGGDQWNKHFCGIACFVKDSNQRSYFIRIFDIKREQMVWQQELYQQFRYKAPRDFLHIFEADRCQAALNFASEDEAKTFKNIVDQKLTERHQRRMNRKSKMAPKATVGNARTPQTVEDSAALVKPTGNVCSKTTRERHVNPVGFDPTKGFEMDKLDPDMKRLFQSVGIKPDDDIDKDTMEFIYDFVDKRGGLDAVKREMVVTPPPPPITKAAATQVPGRQAQTAPRPRAQAPSTPATPPPPPPNCRVGAPPPPRPPAHSGRGAPPPTPRDFPPPPPPFKGGPPAPPPPSPLVGDPPPPPPCCGPQPPPPPTSSVSNELAGLQGMQLKKVSTDRRPPTAREELLGAVKGGSDTLTLMDRLDPDMKRLSQSDGIKPHDNIDKNIMTFICDLIEKMGGIDAVKREMAVNRPPPPITRTGDDDESEDENEDDFDDFILGASSSC